ncbi:MAG: hypothetical protein ACJ72E_07355 [Marmoricola sp.]
MSDHDVAPAPEPTIDGDPDEGNAAGGVDAVEEPVVPDPVTPDSPLNAQLDEEAHVPDAISEPEEPDSDANTADPSAEPSA